MMLSLPSSIIHPGALSSELQLPCLNLLNHLQDRGNAVCENHVFRG